MEINMCKNSNYLKNCNNNSGNDITVNVSYKKNKKRELLINSFIKKFPKVKLHTIVKVNKYYTNNYELENNEKKNLNENEIINNYLMS